MDQLLNALKIAFASEFSFYLKAQNFHWNVTGPDFQEYHALFGDIYSEVYDSIDAFMNNAIAAPVATAVSSKAPTMESPTKLRMMRL